MVGTRARYPVSMLAVFDITYGKIAHDADPRHNGVNMLKLLVTIPDLSYYASRIIPATPLDDYCYILTPFSICLIRMEKNRVNEIQTSSAATAIAEHFSNDVNKPFDPTPSRTERSVLNYSSKELKLDYTARVIPLPGHRLLVCDERTEWQVLTIKFD